jgi:hypothetical protein
MTELNVYTWFSNRELNYCPAHFVVVDTLITQESKQWVLEKLTGRFCLVEFPNYSTIDIENSASPWVFGYYPAFEDPKEATYFQLIWA